MKTPLHFFLLSLTGVASSILLPGFQAAAQTTVATDPVGFATIALQANSDTLVSLPFTRPVEYTGPISSITSTTTNGVTTTTINLGASTNFSSNQFAYTPTTQPKTYYAIIGPLLTNLAATVSATNNGTTITGSGFTPIVAGDEIFINGLAYNVASVTSDTALVLSRAYAGATATGLTASYNHSPKEGSYYTVTGNSTNALTVNLNGDSLSAVASGTSVSLIPYWTLGTAFPASDAGKSYIVSAGAGIRSYQTQILLPDVTSAGVNLAPSAGYINYNGNWILETTDGSVSYSDTILAPTSNFLVRNAATATTFTPSGGVYMNRVTAVLDTQTALGQDNAVSLPRPVATTLNDLGLITSNAFVISSSPAFRSLKDTLLVYDNVSSGVNKAPIASYFYYNGGWRLVGTDGTDDYGTVVSIPYGAGFTIRKSPVSSGASSFLQNTRTY